MFRIYIYIYILILEVDVVMFTNFVSNNLV